MQRYRYRCRHRYRYKYTHARVRAYIHTHKHKCMHAAIYLTIISSIQPSPNCYYPPASRPSIQPSIHPSVHACTETEAPGSQCVNMIDMHLAPIHHPRLGVAPAAGTRVANAFSELKNLANCIAARTRSKPMSRPSTV